MPNNTYENLFFKNLQVQIHCQGPQARERKSSPRWLLGNYSTNHPDQEELHPLSTGSVPLALYHEPLGSQPSADRKDLAGLIDEPSRRQVDG